MSPLIQSLRVDCDAIRKGGYRIDGGAQTRLDSKTHGGSLFKSSQDERDCPRTLNMPNITAAVAEYNTHARKYRGLLKELAIKHHTTPGSILGRINKGKYRRGLTIKQHMEGV